MQQACSEIAGGTKIRLEIDIAGGGCKSGCKAKAKKGASGSGSASGADTSASGSGGASGSGSGGDDVQAPSDAPVSGETPAPV